MKVLTLSQLCQQFSVPRWRMDYAIDKYGPPPVTVAGRTRLWDEAQLPEVQASLDRTQAVASGVRR